MDKSQYKAQFRLLTEAMTAVEHYLIGSTPNPSDPGNRTEWLKFQNAVSGDAQMSIAEARKVRKSMKWARTSGHEIGLRALGFLPEDRNYAVLLSDLNPEIGEAIANPRVLVGI